MEEHCMKKIILVFLTGFLLACQNKHPISLTSTDDELNFEKTLNNLTLEETETLLPNPLFKAIYNKESESLQHIIDQNAKYLLDTNSEGDTPLAFAIKRNDLNSSLFIVNQMDPDHYVHQNNEGETYLYLASQKGFVELIITLSNLFYERQRSSLDYEFSDLDLKTNNGERALHVAKNSAVAEALSKEYYKGWGELPLRKFQLLKNNEDQTFLHTAVKNQNIDLLRWGYQENCSQSESTWNYTRKWTQRLLVHLHADLGYFWNAKNNEGLTALNLATKNIYIEGIELLSSCSWTDYLITDNEGNTPLQNFLLSLDPLVEEHSQEIRDIFLRLAHRQSLLSFNSFSKNINSKNNKQENSLHIAAHLNDSFFYNQLKRYGDTETPNLEGITAKKVFENHQRSIRMY